MQELFVRTWEQGWAAGRWCGKLIYGHDSLAGELGHVIVYRNGRGRLCGCGRKGCIEQYASATGIVKTYYELLLLTRMLTASD